MTKQLEITLKNKSKLTLNWTDSSNLKTWLARQRTRSAWLLDKTDSEFFTEYQDWIQYYCSLIEGMGAFDLPKNANILDIGSGVGIIDLFLAKQFTGSITMLDKNEYQSVNGKQFGPEHPFYNSWEPTIDIIGSSDLDLDRFMFITPNDDWPMNCDLITSHFSWCWHYDVFTYLDQVYNSLKPNGKLVVTIRFTENEDVIDILNNKFDSKPELLYLSKDKQIHTEKKIFDVPGSNYGAIGVWQKLN